MKRGQQPTNVIAMPGNFLNTIPTGIRQNDTTEEQLKLHIENMTSQTKREVDAAYDTVRKIHPGIGRIPKDKINLILNSTSDSLLDSVNNGDIDPEDIEKFIGVPGAVRFGEMLSSLCKSYVAHQFYEAGAKDHDSVIVQIFNQAMDSKVSMKRLVDMYNEYNMALEKRGVISPFNSGLDTDIDVIDGLEMMKIMQNDMTAYFDDTAIDQNNNLFMETMNYVEKAEYFSVIPCFKAGILKIREDIDMRWDILKMDIEERTIDIFLRAWRTDYQFHLNSKTFMFETIVQLSYDPCSSLPHLYIGPYKTPFTAYMSGIASDALTRLYEYIPPKRLRWNKDECMVWKRVVVKFARIMDGLNEEGSLMSGVSEFLPLIVLAFMSTNYLLSKKSARMPKVPRKQKNIHLDSFNQEVHDARKIRTIGIITFNSRTMPREQTRSRVIQYQVASWEVRGHVRHYKDGRVAYVRPHTKYRKCIEDAESKAPAPQSIVIKDT